MGIFDEVTKDELAEAMQMQISAASELVNEQAEYYFSFFQALQKAGFTEAQAIQVICAALKTSK